MSSAHPTDLTTLCELLPRQKLTTRTSFVVEPDLIPPADQALAAVLRDLSDCGVLEDTLIVWLGEFGRRPQITASIAGREHHPFFYSGLMAGGGIKGGGIYSASDEIAQFPSENPMFPPASSSRCYTHSEFPPHSR